MNHQVFTRANIFGVVAGRGIGNNRIVGAFENEIVYGGDRDGLRDFPGGPGIGQHCWGNYYLIIEGEADGHQLGRLRI